MNTGLGMKTSPQLASTLRLSVAILVGAASAMPPSGCSSASKETREDTSPSSLHAQGQSASNLDQANSRGAPTFAPLVIQGGESFTIDSAIMHEARPINVLVPTVYGSTIDEPMPVLYMLDGGLDEDFLHVAGLVQVLVSNGGMRPFVLVGIPNTQRRRDTTGPTENPEDRKIAPAVGGSATFRRFIKDELMPTVRARYRTTGEAAIVGESLAGLFVAETFFQEPTLFTTYIAIDPSLWWNNGDLVKRAGERLAASAPRGQSTLYIASSSEPTITELVARLAGEFSAAHHADAEFRHVPMVNETHATIYHPAALRAFRAVLGPAPQQTKH